MPATLTPARRRRVVANSRSLPAVERVLQALGSSDLPRASVLRVVREEIAKARAAGEASGLEPIVSSARSHLNHLRSSRLQPVINATGVLVHTNFGRAPLPAEAVSALSRIASQYNNLEFDLESGKRGHRAAYVEHQLATLCNAEAATVVNNCAAALVLLVTQFTRVRREVIISRGELVQIGGGFRIPEILEASGAQVREVGTTNQTDAEDYARAISDETGLILKVHRSNFSMKGFVASASTAEVASIARKRRVPFAEDLGAGAVWETAAIPGVPHEMSPRECLSKGAHVVTFSADKLLGGPQAGIIAGNKRMVESIKRHPLFRALRCDKLVLAALEATVDLHLQEGGAQRVPLLVMAHASIETLRSRAEAIKILLSDVPVDAKVITTAAEMGGGGLPGVSIESVALELNARTVAPLLFYRRLLAGHPPVAGTVSRERLILDLRTVFPEQDLALAKAVRAALAP